MNAPAVEEPPPAQPWTADELEAGGQKYSPGKDTAVNGDGTYKVLYDDGAAEKRVKRTLIKRAGQLPPGDVEMTPTAKPRVKPMQVAPAPVTAVVVAEPVTAVPAPASGTDQFAEQKRVRLAELVAAVKTEMGLDDAMPLTNAVTAAVEGLGIEAQVEGMNTKEKANKIAEELGLHIRA